MFWISPAGLRVSPAGLRVSPAGLRVSPAGLRVSPAGLRVSPAGFSWKVILIICSVLYTENRNGIKLLFLIHFMHFTLHPPPFITIKKLCIWGQQFGFGIVWTKLVNVCDKNSFRPEFYFYSNLFNFN